MSPTDPDPRTIARRTVGRPSSTSDRASARTGEAYLVVAGKRTRAQWARLWVAAVAAGLLLLVAFASPISAAPGDTTLRNAVVSPRGGSTQTTIHVAVVYQNANGARADRVTVAIGNDDHPMTRDSAGGWATGVTFRWSGTVALGIHPVVITAVGHDGSRDDLSAGAVVILSFPGATPTPDPTPKPTPDPTPKPTPKPTPTPEPAPTADPKPEPRPNATPRATIKPAPKPAATEQPTAEPGTRGVDVPTAEPTPALSAAPILEPTPSATPPILIAVLPPPDVTAQPTDPPVAAVATDDVPPGGGEPGGDQPGWSAIGSLLALTGLDGPRLPELTVGPTLVSTTGAVTAAMALGLFGRRRRDEGEPDEVLAAAAARGLGVAPLDTSGSPPAAPDLAAAAAAAAAGDDAGAVDEMDSELLLPRWRRPSLLQARRADPVRDTLPASRLTFDEGLVGPLDSRERRVIRYRVVRLLDSPDELRGTEIGFLDQGDEVRLIEKYGAYWLVLSPDGQQGWLHKMTLGEVSDTEAPPADGPTATMPIVADSWTMGESDIDADVMEAYLESRRRAR